MGIKMVIVDLYKVPVGLSLGIIAGILTTSILASLWKAQISTTNELGVAE